MQSLVPKNSCGFKVNVLVLFSSIMFKKIFNGCCLSYHIMLNPVYFFMVMIFPSLDFEMYVVIKTRSFPS